MATTHICLLSEQPIPNLTPLLDEHLKAERVAFLVSPQQKPVLERMQALLQPRGIRVEEIPIENAMDYHHVLERLEQYLAEQDDAGAERVLINATGGTKPMSIAAHMAGFNASIGVFYVQNDHVHWLETTPNQERDFDLEEKMKLKDYLAAYGFELMGKQNEQIPPAHQELFREMVHTTSYHEHIKTLNYLAWQASKRAELTAGLSDRHKTDQGLQALFDRLQQVGLIEAGPESIRFLDREARELCNGLWIEEYCQQQVQSLKDELGSKLQDQARGVEIRGGGNARLDVDNELDLAVLYDNRLYMIECKTRNFEGESPDVEAALYKLATLRRNVGGTFGQCMLVSIYPVASKHKKRAATLGVEIVDGTAVKDFRGTLKRWLQGKR